VGEREDGLVGADGEALDLAEGGVFQLLGEAAAVLLAAGVGVVAVWIGCGGCGFGEVELVLHGFCVRAWRDLGFHPGFYPGLKSRPAITKSTCVDWGRGEPA